MKDKDLNLYRRLILKKIFFSSLIASLPVMSANRLTRKNNKILVVIELTGANDGLNTLIPYSNDEYYKLRPNIGISPKSVRKIDSLYGFNPGMSGFERLYKDGKMAVIHGCGYSNPSYSHFTSMAYWHTGVPNGGEPFGWLGRLSDFIDPEITPNFLVNIDEKQSLAVNSKKHIPVVFDDPEKFSRKGLFQSRNLLEYDNKNFILNSSHNYLEEVSKSAKESSKLVQQAWKKYSTSIDYGIVPMDLPKIASLISADFPTALYYSGYRNNAFDTHVQQVDLHQRLLMYVSDAIYGFFQDLERINRSDDVIVLVFSEFGRRAAENTSLGTDHGTANQMYVIGKKVKGGHYGIPPSLKNLDIGGNLKFTTDFRRVYASLIEGWLDYPESEKILYDKFKTFDIFQ